MHWSGPENIAQVKIDDEGSWALLGSGSTINAVTPEFIKALSLDMGPLSEMTDGTLKKNGFRGLFSQPLDYVFIRVKGYNEDQVALVILDSTPLQIKSAGHPRHSCHLLNHECHQGELDELSVSLSGLRISHLLAGC